MCDYACQSDSNLVARFLSVTGQLITPRVNRGVGGCNSDWDEIISEEDKFLLKLGFIKIIYLCTQPSTFLSLYNVKKRNTHQTFKGLYFLQNQYYCFCTKNGLKNVE